MEFELCSWIVAAIRSITHFTHAWNHIYVSMFHALHALNAFHALMSQFAHLTRHESCVYVAMIHAALT